MSRLSLALCLALLAACAGTPARTPAPLPPPVVPARSPNAFTPVSSLPRTIAAPVIKVGLLSDQTSVTFPRTADGYYLMAAGGGPSMLKRGFTIAAPHANAVVRHAVQVSSVSDQSSAEALAQRIRTERNVRVDLVFDPAGGAYRVLAGDFADSASAEPLRGELTNAGYGKGMLIVRRPSDEPFEKRHELVDDEGDRHTLTGDSLLVMPVSAETIVIDNKPYRTAARVFINARGLFNIINELNMEEYLRGVVPAEMGSNVYDELEALKAQAIAARTYAVKNMGGFRYEGYDICPGPACQAYKGFSGEEKLTDQAVRETAGLILTHNGQPIDALYTSTCGGETSDVGTMFYGRNEPYLRRARCVEYEMVSIPGRADSGLLTEWQANARIFAAIAGLPESGTNWSGRDVERAVQAAMRVAGFTDMPSPAAASSRRGAVLGYLASMLGFDRHARVLTLPEDRKYFFPQSAETEDEVHLAAAFLVKYGIWPAQAIDRIDLNAPMPREELYAILGSWLKEQAALAEVTGKIQSVSGRSLMLKAEGKVTPHAIPEGVPVFRRVGDRYQEYKSVPIMIGDRAFIQRGLAKTPVAVIVQANFDGAAYDRTSSFSNWTRSYRADELVTSINRRNPIQELVDIRPLIVDASKRVAEMEVKAEGGRTFILRGLPVRWSLNIPDNLFVYQKTKDPDGVDRYTFFGKGWGHGIGMCQVGAYGMAFRGLKAEQILQRYYTNVELVAWRP